MTTVFISYRRQDSADICDRITNHLEWRYGKPQIFRDVRAILAGSNFDSDIQQALAECRVMLVLIGPKWASIQGDDGQRRLDNPRDYVRLEVATALRERKLVIPVLVRGAPLPHPAELPPDLAELAQRQPAIVRGDPAFQQDMATIYRVIDPLARRGVAHWAVFIAGIIFSVGFLLAQMLGFLRSPLSGLSAYMAIFAVLLAAPLALIRVFITGRWQWLPVALVIPATFAAGIILQNNSALPRAVSAILFYAMYIACGTLQIAFGTIGPSARRVNLAPLSALAWKAAGRRIVGMTSVALIAFVAVYAISVVFLALFHAQVQGHIQLAAVLGGCLLIHMVTLTVAAVQGVLRTSQTRERPWLILFSVVLVGGFLPGVVCVLFLRDISWGYALFTIAALALMAALMIYGIRSWRRGARELTAMGTQ